MVRKEHVDRIINAWKNLDTAPKGDAYEKAWAIVTAVDRNATPAEREAAKEVVSRGPWMKRKKK